jgi:hypothetical protein
MDDFPYDADDEEDEAPDPEYGELPIGVKSVKDKW